MTAQSSGEIAAQTAADDAFESEISAGRRRTVRAGCNIARAGTIRAGREQTPACADEDPRTSHER
jgi:hypothetical protein